MRSLPATLLLAVAVLAPGEPASAAAPWSGPVSVGPVGLLAAPDVAFTSAGTRLLSADYDAFRSATGPGRIFAGTAERVVRGLTGPPVAVGRDGVAYLTHSARAGRLGLALTVGGGRSRTLSRDVVGAGASLAANARGDLAVAWVEQNRATFRTVVKLAVRRAGGRLTRPRVVAGGYVGTPMAGNLTGRGVAVAVGRRGELLVAVQRMRVRPTRRTLEVRAGRIGGPLGRAQTLGPEQGYVTIAIAIGASGRAVVAWGTQDVGEEADEARRVHAALREPGRARFGASQALDPGGPALGAAGTVAAALTPAGEATVVWSSPRMEGRRHGQAIRAAVAAPAGRFAPQQDIGPAGVAGDVAVGGDGTTVALFTEWGDDSYGRARVFAVPRAPGAARFGGLEQVGGPEADERVRAATDPVTGAVTAVWAGAAGERRPEDGSTPRVLRVATRSR